MKLTLPLIAVLLAAACGKAKPVPTSEHISMSYQCMELSTALTNLMAADNGLKDALILTEKQRDRFFEMMKTQGKIIKKQEAIINLYKSEYMREHSVPIDSDPEPGTWHVNPSKGPAQGNLPYQIINGAKP